MYVEEKEMTNATCKNIVAFVVFVMNTVVLGSVCLSVLVSAELFFQLASRI